jgi:hypothetical protein
MTSCSLPFENTKLFGTETAALPIIALQRPAWRIREGQEWVMAGLSLFQDDLGPTTMPSGAIFPIERGCPPPSADLGAPRPQGLEPDYFMTTAIPVSARQGDGALVAGR